MTNACRHSWGWLVAASAVLCAMSGCMHATPRPRDATKPAMTENARRPAAPRAKAPDLHGPAKSHWIGAIARAAIGPFIAWGRDTGMVAWVATSERTGDGELVVVPIGQDGAPLRSPQVVTTVPREATSLVIRPTHEFHGWLIAWTALLDRGESLTIIDLAPDGTARDKPSDVQRTGDHIAWADIVPTPKGALCVWAEETAAGTANLLAGSIGSDGKPRGMPVRVARDVSRWGVTPDGDGTALALVSGNDSDKNTAGRLSWLQLDSEGAAKGVPVLVTPEPSVGSDVEIAAVPDGWVVGWTDWTGEDARVMLASIDAAGHTKGPFSALHELGGSALVALTAASSGLALAWESPRTSGRSYRVLHLASVPAEGPLVAQPVTSMRIVGSAKADLVAAGEGFALLTVPTGVCMSGDTPLPDCPAVPTFVRYDARLATLQAEPFLVGDPRVQASLGWGLHCTGDRCIALAATSESPTPIFAVDLAPRTSPFEPPPAPASPADAPRAVGITTLVSGPPYAEVAAVRVAGAALVATMTSAVDVPNAPPGAHVASIVVRAYDDAGKPLEQPHTLTSRALPVGRVALAARGAGDKVDQVAAAWVVRDEGDPQVHVATLDAHGHRIKEVQVTIARGDAGDVSVAPVDGGWIVGWVDWRDGNGEVYAAKLDRDLARLSPDQRITQSPGDKADVALAGAGGRAWIAWSDPRESPREGIGDVYVATLGARDAKRATDEVRVLATAAHSRSPAITAVGKGALVAWIEDAPPGVDAPGAALFARVDEAGRVADTGALQLAEPGRPTALALEGSPAGTRVVVATAAHGVVTLDAAVIKETGATARAWPLVDLDAPGAFDAAVALAGGALIYDDVGATAGERRVRSLAIAW
ncbi:MAG TPA: hypothetical protein VGM06_07910 [Polyangiaceae bacterium]